MRFTRTGDMITSLIFKGLRIGNIDEHFGKMKIDRFRNVQIHFRIINLKWSLTTIFIVFVQKYEHA